MDTKQISTIISGAVAGQSMQSIANEIGMSKTSVCHMINKEDIKNKIEEAKEKIVNKLLSKAMENIEYVVEGYKTTDDKDYKSHGYDASVKILQGIGILPSHSQSVFIQQINNTNNITIDPQVMALAQGFAPVEEEENVIECDFTVDDGV